MRYCILLLILSTYSSPQAQNTSDSLEIYFAEMQKYALSGELDSLYFASQRSLSHCQLKKDSLCLARTFEQMASSHILILSPDSSYKYFQLAATVYEQIKEYREASIMYKKAANLYKTNLLFEDAVKMGQRSFELLYQLGDSVEMSYMLNILSSLNQYQGNYQLAIDQAEQSFEIASKTEDFVSIGLALQAMGLAYARIEAYDQALELGNKSLQHFEEENWGDGKMWSYEVIASALIGLGSYAEARQTAQSMLSQATKVGNMQYESKARFLLAKSLIRNQEYESGLKELRQSMQVSSEIMLVEKLMESEHLMYECYKAMDSTTLALRHLTNYMQLRDSSYSIQKSREVEKLQAQYSLTNKQREISQLKTETELKDLRIQQSRGRFLLAIVVAGGVLAILLLFYNRKLFRQKFRFALEKEQMQRDRMHALLETEEKERKRVAQELHDGLGQLLSVARLQISSLDEEEENEKIQQSVKLVDDAVDEVRSISHNLMPKALSSIGLMPALRELVHRINESGKIRATLAQDHDIELDEKRSVTLYRIIQEVVNNALKYSESDKIIISIDHEGELFKIKIQDNGKGFDTASIEKSEGIGWKNIYSRVDLLKGQIDISSNSKNGTSVELTIPT